MSVQFATCNKKTALGYIQTVYPSIEIKESMIDKLLDLVDKDILRVQDPLMYGKTIGIIAGNKYQKLYDEAIKEAQIQLSQNLNSIKKTA